MSDGNTSGPASGLPAAPRIDGPPAGRASGVSRAVAVAIPCAIGLVLALAGVDAPSRGSGRPTSALRQENAAGAAAEAAFAGVPSLAEPADGRDRTASLGERVPEALQGAVTAPERETGAGSATLDPAAQKAVDKLEAKIAKQQAKVAAKEAAILAHQAALALAQQALILAQGLPELTAAEIKAKQKALKKAYSALLKWQKKIDKAEASIALANGKIADYVEQIEVIDPGHFDDMGEPGGDDGPPDGQGGNGDDGETIPSGGIVNLPLIVQEVLPSGSTGGFARSGAIATFGIPFAETDEVGFVNGRPALAVLNSDTWQFRCLATWPSGSVKWALVDVASDVPAGGLDTSLEIINGDGRSGPDDLAFDDGSLITISNGDLIVQVSKTDFDVFHRVWLGGQELMAAGSSAGIVGTTVEGGLILPKAGSVTVDIEENGPARCVVRADGTLRTLTGLDLFDFTCRIIARAGSRDVQVDFTVRNANITMPHHTIIDGLGLYVHVNAGAAPVATVSKHNGPLSTTLLSGDWMFLHQAQSSAYTYQSVDEMLGQDGYQVVKNGEVLYPLGDKTKYPAHGYADLTGATGGVTVAYRFMPFQSPASLELLGSGDVYAGLFSARHEPGHFWTFGWRQHESRTVSFSFHAPGQGDPAAVAAALDLPVAGRAADYLQYDRAGVLPYRLVTLAEENQAFAEMGLNYTVATHNEVQMVTRWLYAHESGGSNNYDSIEKRLGGDWLRQGLGGAYLTGLDLALYKSEWQIERSDNFLDVNDPGAVNPELPHETGYAGDYEHRYRDGIILAYWLTGDERLRDALFDEAEILNHLYFYAQERGMVQSLRAIARVGEFTGDPGGALKAELKSWLQTYCTRIVNINTADPFLSNWGWEAAPDVGTRRFFVTNVGTNEAPPAGNNFQTRGFFTASLAPLGMYHAWRWLGPTDPQGVLARGRLRDLAFYARNELYPYKANPAARYLTYQYAVNEMISYVDEEADAHPLMLGFGEAFSDTGDTQYIQRAIEQFQGFKAHDNGPYANNLYGIENRLDVQHFLRTYLEWLAETGQL